MESVDATGTQKADEKSDHRNEPNCCEIVKTRPSDTLGAEGESISVKDEWNGTSGKARSGGRSEESSEAQNENGSSSWYKIPSHVFERSNTKTAPEWSVASNESLFSIHVGTMSFSTEQQTWFKSGELDKYGEVMMMMSNQPPHRYKDLRIDQEQQASGCGCGCGVTEARAAETMREVIMENSGEGETETHHDHGQPEVRLAATSHSIDKLASPSDNSGRSDHGSAKSFAFQLTGDGGKSYNGSPMHFEEKAKQQQQEDTEGAEAEEPKPDTHTHTHTPTSTKPPSNKRSSCFACFPFCQ